MNEHKLKNLLIKHEGIKLNPYYCTAGKFTIGIGRNLTDKGISNDEALYLLENDIVEFAKDLNNIFPNFYTFSDNRQMALIDMIFNLGRSRFCGFKKMIEAIKNNDFEEAGRHSFDSKWAAQVGNRAVEIADMLKSG